MAEFDRGEVRANGLRFHYLTRARDPWRCACTGSRTLPILTVIYFPS
jgi:hypothetical protein